MIVAGIIRMVAYTIHIPCHFSIALELYILYRESSRHNNNIVYSLTISDVKCSFLSKTECQYCPFKSRAWESLCQFCQQTKKQWLLWNQQSLGHSYPIPKHVWAAVIFSCFIHCTCMNHNTYCYGKNCSCTVDHLTWSCFYSGSKLWVFQSFMSHVTPSFLCAR